MPERNLSQPARRVRWTGILLGLLLGAGALRAETIRIVGSDQLGAEVAALLEQQAADFDQPLDLSFAGTRPALDRLAAGDVAMALLVDYPGAPALPESWQSVPLGYFTALVVAPAKVSVDQVSFADLEKIFGANSAVASLRWGDLGARGAWITVPVIPRVTSAADGLAEALFHHVVLRDGEFKPGVERGADNAATLAATRRDEGSLAVVSRLPADPAGLKTLLVAGRDEGVAFGPTAENLHAGDYPLRLTLRLAFPRERAGELLSWLRLWHSERMATALAASGVVALPVPARNQQVFDLELLD